MCAGPTQSRPGLRAARGPRLGQAVVNTLRASVVPGKSGGLGGSPLLGTARNKADLEFLKSKTRAMLGEDPSFLDTEFI